MDDKTVVLPAETKAENEMRQQVNGDMREMLDLENFRGYFESMSRRCHAMMRERGFWPEVPSERNMGEAIALVHSELSEALEGHRKGAMDDHCPIYKSVEVEFADAIFRLLDMAAGFGLNVGEAFIAKYNYNKNRPHKHGKNY